MSWFSSILCIKVAISLPETISDEKITPLHRSYLTSLVILHNNYRITPSSQTNPIFKGVEDLKPLNPTADYIQDPSPLELLLSLAAEESVQAKYRFFSTVLNLFFQQVFNSPQ